MNTENNKLIVFALIILFMVTLITLLNQDSNINNMFPLDITGGATSIIDYNGIKFSEPLFTISSRFFNLSSTSATATISIVAMDDMIYKYGYISINGGEWKNITLNGNISSGDWFRGKAIAFHTLKFSELGLINGTSSDNYILIYSCSKNLLSWNCHDNNWQIEQFNITLYKNITLPPVQNSTQNTTPIQNSTNSTTNFTNPSQIVVPSNTILLYDFSTGNANDLSGNLRNGIIRNATYNLTGGPSGKGSFVFDGNDYISAQNSNDLWREDIITLELWAKKTSNSTALEYVIAKRDTTKTSYGIQTSNGQWNFFVRDWTIAVNSTIVPNKWTHLVGTYNRYNNSMVLYVDGKYVGKRSLAEAIPLTTATDFMISGRRNNGSLGFVSPFKGEIARVAIYDTFINESQASELYQTGTYTNGNNFPRIDWKLSTEQGDSSTHKTLTATDCDYIMPLNKTGKVSPVDFPGISPGDTICIEAGKRKAIDFRNFHGAPGNYIRIVNYGGAVIMDQDNGALSIYNSTYINVTGNGYLGTKYGIKNVYASIFGIIMYRTSDFDMSFVEITYPMFAGGSFKADPTCDLQNNQGYFVQKNVNLHHNYIHDTDCEGLYIGFTFHAGYNKTSGCVGTMLYSHDLINTSIHDNLFLRTGCEAIQMTGDPNGKIYNNIIDTSGWINHTFAPGQNNGIQIGGKFGGDINNNIIRNVREYSIIIFAQENTRIYNNILENTGTIYIHSAVNATGGIRFYNNLFNRVQTFYGDKTYGTFQIMNNASFFIIENNIIVKDADRKVVSKIWGKENFTERNNLVITTISQAGLDSNYRPLSSSPVIDAGNNVSLIFDYDYKTRPIDAYDIGPFEYQK